MIISVHTNLQLKIITLKNSRPLILGSRGFKDIRQKLD